MKTLEMIKKAEITGKTYVSEDMRYSKAKGFHDSEGFGWGGYSFEYLNDVLDIDNWEELEPKKMTLKEIETKLGYPIEIVSE